MNSLAVGIDLGGTSIKAGLVSSTEGILSLHVRETRADEGPNAVLDDISCLIAECLSGLPEETNVPIGIGAPGTVHFKKQTVTNPPNFPGWGVVNIADAICLRMPSVQNVIVDNDANVAALGSARFGAGQAFNSFLMVTLGTGVGGAIVFNGKLFRGDTGGAGELGQVSIDYEGPIARSGIPGAIEAYIGQRYLSKHARRTLTHQPDSLVHAIAEEQSSKITPRILSLAATKGDQAAIDILSWAGGKLGFALGSAINLLDIKNVVVGGGVSGAGEFILGPAREAVHKSVTPSMRDNILIVQETLGNKASVLGAAFLALEQSNGEQLITHDSDV
jgi:glucokinase